jgi:flagellar L-ring protein precursor FlgH
VNTYSSQLYNNLYRASKVGDTVMVVISEEAQGSGTGNTKSDRKYDDTRSISGLGGLFEKLERIIGGLGSTSLTAQTDSKFQGKASTDRNGKLFAKISARVTKVLRNGNMAIRGEQHIKLNKEEQIIILEGLIRPYDILPNNTVSSSSIADARITYSGFGVVADRQSPGWLVRVLDKIWPL